MRSRCSEEHEHLRDRFDGVEPQAVNELKYLGSTVCENGGRVVEVPHRLKEGARMWEGGPGYLWRNKDLSFGSRV